MKDLRIRAQLHMIYACDCVCDVCVCVLLSVCVYVPVRRGYENLFGGMNILRTFCLQKATGEKLGKMGTKIGFG